MSGSKFKIVQKSSIKVKAHQSLTTFLLGNMPFDWSTALPSITTLLLAQSPSDWSTAISRLTTLSLLSKQENTYNLTAIFNCLSLKLPPDLRSCGSCSIAKYICMKIFWRRHSRPADGPFET